MDKPLNFVMHGHLRCLTYGYHTSCRSSLPVSHFQIVLIINRTQQCKQLAQSYRGIETQNLIKGLLVWSFRVHTIYFVIWLGWFVHADLYALRR